MKNAPSIFKYLQISLKSDHGVEANIAGVSDEVNAENINAILNSSNSVDKEKVLRFILSAIEEQKANKKGT